MGMETNGRIHLIYETKQITERFRKREFVVEISTNPKYPQFVLFQLTGDRCESLDGFSPGDEVNIDFSLRGREWTNPKGEVKYFNSLDVWEVKSANAHFGVEGASNMGEAPPPPTELPPGFDDVPF